MNAESDFGRRQAPRMVRVVVAVLAGATLFALVVGGLQPARAKHGGGGGGGVELAALNTLPVPTPPDIQRFVRDSAAARKLGKALFWDMQAGSDGRTACATCHFSAGADNRSRNELNPRGGGFALNGKGANAQLTADDFPFHRLSDPNNAASAVTFDTDNVSGSQGVLPSHFTGVSAGDPFDAQSFDPLDSDFHVGSVNVRRATGRNTPSVINAVFNFRNFWDGRAQNEFNGVDPFGTRDPDARVGEVNAAGGIDRVAVSIANSSLASQADGPPGNPVEMSSDGRTLSDIGTKLLSVRPLASQQVSPSDSVLGGDVAASGRGLGTSYADMIRQAFQPQWWDSSDSVTAPNGRSYSLIEFNFPLFWGLAIQSYESTLVSDQTPVDRFLNGDVSALSAQAQDGMGIFNGKGGCQSCHEGPAFSDAVASEIARKGVVRGATDTGFHDDGVRPTATDPGIGGSDPFGHPLSASGVSTGVQGFFKTPGLRNIALTAPYFHNGGELTLRQVVDFYSRGGDFANPTKELAPLGLTDAEKDALVAFMEALTDPRVRDQSAPFDHPQLFVPVGEQTSADGSVATDAGGRAVDCFKEVPATGAAGGAPLTPLPGFTGPPCDTPPPLEVAVRAAAPAAASPAPQEKPAPAAASPRSCVVPKLKGRTLGKARLLLGKADCGVGFVGRPHGRGLRLRIFRQRPAAGTVKPGGYRVSIRLQRLRLHRVKHRRGRTRAAPSPR